MLITTWYLEGVTKDKMPSSLEELKSLAEKRQFDRGTLLNATKWDYLIKIGKEQELSGYVRLRLLAQTRRGIATGANEFFHIEAQTASRLALHTSVLAPCVGKASDVEGLTFDKQDFHNIVRRGKRAYLVTLGGTLDRSERAYVAEGERQGINKRYLTASRSSWYTMERQKPAPIWAAVFGRTNLRFVLNEAGVQTLTTFHCVYPLHDDPTFVKCLAACLNAPSVQALARAQVRVYGSGLLKFEPKDLLDIQVPDLRKMLPADLKMLAAAYDNIIRVARRREPSTEDWIEIETRLSRLPRPCARMVMSGHL